MSVGGALTVLRAASMVGVADYRTLYTAKTWLAGTFLRFCAQVTFWAMFGRLLDSEADVRFLLIGNSVLLAAVSTNFTVASTTWERRAGTLPLLVASPTPLWLPMVGRSTEWLPDAVVSSAGALFVVGTAFGVPVDISDVPAVVGLLCVAAVASYGMALALGAMVIRFVSARNVVANLSTGVMMVACGVNIPLDALPEPVARIALAIPLTSALDAVRSLLDGADGAHVVGQASVALAVGAVWAAAAAGVLERFSEAGRRSGSHDFAP